jgi:hypothetical protein
VRHQIVLDNFLKYLPPVDPTLLPMPFIVPWTNAEKRFPFEENIVLKDGFIGENINLKLINSATYKIVYPFLVGGFFVSYLLSFVFFLPFHVILIMTAVSIIIPFIFTYYSKHFQETGRLSIDIRHIIIAQKLKPPFIVPIAMLQDFKISRGATVHKLDRGPYPADTNDNWISFTFKKKLYKFEFCIANQEENDDFELMISRLRAVYPEFYFESI